MPSIRGFASDDGGRQQSTMESRILCNATILLRCIKILLMVQLTADVEVSSRGTSSVYQNAVTGCVPEGSMSLLINPPSAKG